jgi:hypothetical protein
MKCNYPQCTGNHSGKWRISEMCPAAQEKRRASWRAYERIQTVHMGLKNADGVHCYAIGWWSSPDPHCADCKRSVKDDTYYVHDKVWAETNMGFGFLCQPCLSKRLGRKLVKRDFWSLPPRIYGG